MLTGEKILITGASGLVGLQFAGALAKDNEVWAVARYLNPEDRVGARNAWSVDRRQVEQLGVRTHKADLLGDLSGLPQDFTYVLHFAHTRLSMDRQTDAIEINSLGAGRILEHCRTAKAALVMSSTTIYANPPTIDTPIRETDPLGPGATGGGNPTSAAAKVALEAVVRFCAGSFGLRVVVPRLNVPYGPASGWCIRDMDAVVAGTQIGMYAEPWLNAPIHFDDMFEQLEPLLDAASTSALIVNWCGDEVIDRCDWIRRAGLWSGKTPVTGTALPGIGNISDATRRRSITGPCKRRFWDEYEAIYRQRHGTPSGA